MCAWNIRLPGSGGYGYGCTGGCRVPSQIYLRVFHQSIHISSKFFISSVGSVLLANTPLSALSSSSFESCTCIQNWRVRMKIKYKQEGKQFTYEMPFIRRREPQHIHSSFPYTWNFCEWCILREENEILTIEVRTTTWNINTGVIDTPLLHCRDPCLTIWSAISHLRYAELSHPSLREDLRNLFLHA